jgi:hypothetical protein
MRESFQSGGRPWLRALRPGSGKPESPPVRRARRVGVAPDDLPGHSNRGSIVDAGARNLVFVHERPGSSWGLVSIITSTVVSQNGGLA